MFCKKCGAEVEGNFCSNCGLAIEENIKPQSIKVPIYKKWWFWVIIAFIIFVIAIGSSSDNDTVNSSSSALDTVTVQSENKPIIPEEFARECPIGVSASIEDNIIGVPELSCNIKNKTDKEISAVKLYFLPKDVYGEDVNTIFTTNELYTDTPIDANSNYKTSWQMLDSEIKTGNVYVYSVYFADGTEWGDKDASVSKIKKYGFKISAEN